MASYPWQVALQFEDSNSTTWICTGTIIAKNWILTAGHCCEDKIEVTAFVNYGTEEQYYRTSKVSWKFAPKIEPGLRQ